MEVDGGEETEDTDFNLSQRYKRSLSVDETQLDASNDKILEDRKIPQNDWVSYKVVVVGESKSGKSALIRRLGNKAFSKNPNITPTGESTEFKTKCKNTKVNLNVFDTSGNDRFIAQTKTCLKDTDGIVLTFDMSSLNYIKDIDKWLGIINNLNKEELNEKYHPKLFIIGTQSDKVKENSNTMIQTISLFLKQRKTHFECLKFTSSKENLNIQLAFNEIAEFLKNSSQISVKNTFHKPSKVGIFARLFK
jgi:small GTP-binding protein